MKRITISLDVPDEDHENVLRLLEGLCKADRLQPSANRGDPLVG
jgi:hypothetical protein